MIKLTTGMEWHVLNKGKLFFVLADRSNFCPFSARRDNSEKMKASVGTIVKQIWLLSIIKLSQ